MPTGYTADPYDGKDVAFQEFVMKCARAFGVLITMRDDPLDAPIPDEFRPSDYHKNAVIEAEQRITEIEHWDDAKAEQEAQKAYRDVCRERKRSISRQKTRKQRCQTMLTQVEAWVPPTPDHIELKKFMVQQLEESMRYDCGYTQDVPEVLSGEAYKQQLIERAREDMEYHTKEHEKEVERAQERTEWVRTLRVSLGITT